MRRMVVAVALATAVALAPGAAGAQVSGQVYIGPAPQQQPVYGQPVYGQPTYGQPVYAQPQYAPQPRPMRTEQRAHVGLIVGGAVMLGVSWLVNAALISPFAGWSASSGYQPSWEAFRYAGLVPVAGPWIQLALKPNGLSDDGWGTYLVIDGLLQAAGLTMLILGATITETVTVYGDRRTGPSLSLGVGPGSLSATGTF
ncbi:MAG: hypothetical protein KF729_19125 [Sandaracinaceae bacterium]|nr:hypothetical protein [Sandaracinaceae bacterium]